jgi:hypothetical protein
VTDNRMRGIRCGIPDCAWGVERALRQVTPQTVSDCYAVFWDHLVAAHGLDPDLNEVPGITEAAFHIDLDRGTLTIRITAKGTGYSMAVTP